MKLRIISHKAPVLVQDLGRFGYTIFGVSTSGAADRKAFLQAHRLLGTTDDLPVLEILFGCVEFYCTQDLFFTVTGAPVLIGIDNIDHFSHRVLFAPAHSHITVGFPFHGVRSYFAIRGELMIPSILGSYSTDTLSNIGPQPLKTGDEIAITPAKNDLPSMHYLPQAMILVAQEYYTLNIHLLSKIVLPDDIFTAIWTVHPWSNRVAVRLYGAKIPKGPEATGDSEPIFRGAIQLTPEGELVIFLADHPTTGGYQIIGLLEPESCDIVAQLRPGYRIRMKSISINLYI